MTQEEAFQTVQNWIFKKMPGTIYGIANETDRIIIRTTEGVFQILIQPESTIN